MISPQQLFIRWIEFSLAGALLLVAAKIAIARLRQPADRINLILMTFVMTAVVPLLMIFTPVPHWQLGFVAFDQPMASETSLTAPRSDALSETLPVSLSIDPRRVDASPAVATLPVATPVAFRESGTASGTPALSATATEAKQITGPRNFDPWWFAAFGLIVTYGLAISYFLIESIIGTRRLTQLANRAQPAGKQLALAWEEITDGCANQVRLLISSEITSPMAYGILQPAIMIPESIATGDPAILRFCLKHEWTHIENGDLRAWGMTWVCQFLIWFQPLFWMLRRDLRVCQDFLADHRAAGDGLARIEYSALLLAFTKLRIAPPIPGAIAFFDRSSHLSRRIHMLLNATLTLRPRSPRLFCVGAGIVLLACAALFGAIRLNAADGGAQAAQPDLLIQGAQPESSLQETKPPAEREKKSAEGDNVPAKIIRGSIVDQAGQPVAQAKLCLPLNYRPRRTAQATTDDGGQFELKVPMEWLDEETKGFFGTLWAYAPGLSIASQSVRKVLYENGSEIVVKIALPPQEKTSFKILTPNGDPIRDALVQPHHYLASAYEYVPEELLKVIGSRTDAEGMATFSMLQRKSLMSIQIISEAFGDQRVRVDHPPMEASRTIRLRAPGRIEGKLISDQPEWIRGVRVSVSTEDEGERNKPHGNADVVTDNEGRYVVPVIASGGPVRFYVAIDSKLPVRPRLESNPSLKAGETMRMDIPLIVARLVHGTIQSKSSGKPVTNVEIILNHGNLQQTRAKTNDQGYFEGLVVPGPVWFQLMLPDKYLELGDHFLRSQQVPEGVEKFELSQIEVTDSRDLTGTLVGEKDEPLADKQIVAMSGFRHFGSGKTDARGRFKLKVPEGVETNFEVYLDKKGSQSEPAQVLQKDPLIVRYAAGKGWLITEPERANKADVTLTGRVLADGKPLVGIGFTLTRDVIQPGTVNKSNPSHLGQGGLTRVLQVAKVESDADGRYRLIGLKAGDRYSITVKSPFTAADHNWKYQFPHMQTVEAQAKGEIALPDLNLRKLSQTLAGTVVDPAGKPVKGAHVSVRFQGRFESVPRLLLNGHPPWTTTDSAGRFHLEQLPDEPLDIFAHLQPVNGGGAIRYPASVAVEKNQQNIRIVLDPSLVEKEK